MNEVRSGASQEEVERATELLNQLLSFSSHDVAIAFLHHHRRHIPRALVELLKERVVHEIRVDIDRALRLADLAHKAASLIGDRQSLALGYHALAMALDCSGQYARALEFYNKAEQAYQAEGQPVEAARLERAKLPVLMYLGRYQEALQVAQQARQVLEQYHQSLLLAQLDTNVGSIYERLAQYHTALLYYQRAADVFQQLGDRQSLAAAQTNLAVVYAHLGEFENSLQLYQQAQHIYRALGLHLWAIQVEHNIAWLYFLRGRFDHALKQFQWIEAEARQHGDITQAAICRLDLAEVYLQLNAFDDAREAAELAAGQFAQLQMGYELAKARMYQSLAALHLGAFEQSAALLKEARALFVREGNEVYQALCDLYGSDIAMRQQQWEKAIALCQAAHEVFHSQQLDYRVAAAELQLAKIYLLTGDLTTANSLCEQAWARLEPLAAPWLKYQWFHLKGNVRERLGDTAHAYESYQQALSQIEQMRSTIHIDEFKSSFVKDKLKVYEDLVGLCLRDGSPAKQQEAFRVVEAAKSRALVDLLAGALQMKSQAQPDQQTTQAWNTLREQLDWYYNKLHEHETTPGARSVELTRQLRQKISDSEAELARLLRHLQAQDPEYVSLQIVASISSDRLARHLSDDEALLEYFIIDDQIHAFVVNSSGLCAAQPTGSVSQVLRLLRALRFQLHKPLLHTDYTRRHEAALLQFSQEHLRALYETLVEPVAWALDRPRWIIVPHGLLHYVPFHALVDEQGYLLDRYEISYAPSAHTFSLCRQRPEQTHDHAMPALIVGVPDTNLPHIADEVERIRSLIPGAQALVGEQASLAEFKRQAEHCRFLHLASHAIFRRDNPLFSALKLADSWLNFYDIFHLRLQAELVTLSACQTGVNRVFAGDELVGLMRGFMYAGAPSVIVSLWAVNDRSTAELMGAFYSYLRQGESARSALRQAQLAVRRAYPHPYYWAPFVLIGRP